jgi:ribosomal-protein-alanine N-acetyltransferase
MQLSVREASLDDRQRLANMIHFEVYVHRHLDWRGPLDWLGHSPYLVAESRDKLTGALACPLDEPEIPWIRLFVAGTGYPLGEVWQSLWEAGWEALIRLGKQQVAAIVMQDWFRELLEASGFIHTGNVVVLMSERYRSLGLPKPIPGTIRAMTPADLEVVYQLDSETFRKEWRNSPSALALAYQQAALATVVLDGQDVIGYQISTASQTSAHLARLAVHPRMQNKGIGYALVYDILEEFYRRGINQITVNTQQNNLASLAVYTRAGFTQMEEYYPVYQCFAE